MLLDTILTTRHVRLKEKHGPDVIDEYLGELDRPGNL
jgi:hypothetical protein